MALDDTTEPNSTNPTPSGLHRDPETSDQTQMIQLFEEKLVVNRSRRKVGEIVVRKVIENRIIEVPVRREKIVVECVNPNQTLAEIDLGEAQTTSISIQDFNDLLRPGTDDKVIRNNFATIKDAVKFLAQVNQRSSRRLNQVSLTLLLRVGAEAETAYFKFSHLAIAIQTLNAIAPTLLNHCRGVQVDLAFDDS